MLLIIVNRTRQNFSPIWPLLTPSIKIRCIHEISWYRSFFWKSRLECNSRIQTPGTNHFICVILVNFSKLYFLLCKIWHFLYLYCRVLLRLNEIMFTKYGYYLGYNFKIYVHFNTHNYISIYKFKLINYISLIPITI